MIGFPCPLRSEPANRKTSIQIWLQLFFLSQIVAAGGDVRVAANFGQKALPKAQGCVGAQSRPSPRKTRGRRGGRSLSGRRRAEFNEGSWVPGAGVSKGRCCEGGWEPRERCRRAGVGGQPIKPCGGGTNAPLPRNALPEKRL